MPKPAFVPDGVMSTLTLDVGKGHVQAKEGKLPLAGIVAAVQTEDMAYRGVTAGRVVALGVFALAAKKDKVRTSSLLLIEAADGTRVVRPVLEKKLTAARDFVEKVNAAAAAA